ncbi:MAG: saccharopine dehydrogenase [Deltaproteobacteria bacterium]|nr:MAG: saccharopine dehydrogenase [Deltaproteobacteria bacterium]
MRKSTLWLRHETKPFEERTALTPLGVKAILDAGHDVVVEESPTRIYPINEYKEVGAIIAPMNSWITQAPESAIIIGLKELENNSFPLIHRHIHFAHCYKGQVGSKETLTRFARGGGLLYDLEYLVDENKRRIAAFGVWAGYTGAALGVAMWAASQLNESLNDEAPLTPYENSVTMAEEMSRRLDKVGRKPSVLIIGANGRCGIGAQKLLESLDINATLWGSKDTKGRGAIKEILEFDLLINTALMKDKVTPWLTDEIIDEEERNLTAISDISCDPTGPCNPLPIYSEGTTMDKPVSILREDELLEITAIDHLPSLLPRESSDDFCQQLLPHLISFLDGKLENSPWERSLEIFFRKTEELKLGEVKSIRKVEDKPMWFN